MAPIHLMVHYPETEEGRIHLAKRVSDVHTSIVNQRLKSLNCPEHQKLELLDAIMDMASHNSSKRTAE